jgi:hypothetical protein
MKFLAAQARNLFMKGKGRKNRVGRAQPSNNSTHIWSILIPLRAGIGVILSSIGVELVEACVAVALIERSLA